MPARRVRVSRTSDDFRQQVFELAEQVFRRARDRVRAELPPRFTLKEATQRFQREVVLDALRARAIGGRWNIKGTARDLGIVRSQLYHFIERLELPRTPRQDRLRRRKD